VSYFIELHLQSEGRTLRAVNVDRLATFAEYGKGNGCELQIDGYGSAHVRESYEEVSDMVREAAEIERLAETEIVETIPGALFERVARLTGRTIR